jgi:cyanophycinase-like exopeptidase
VGLKLAIVPHWNNTEGGAHLDTSHCFMSAERFAQLRQLLPPDATVLGIDEHTSCIVDVNRNTLVVRGQGQITVITGDEERCFAAGTELPLAQLGEAALLLEHD